MAAIERIVASASQRADRLLTEIGREIHTARVTRGLSQTAVAAAAGLMQAQVSRVERSLYPGITIDALARLCAVVGLELSVKLYPAGQPLRDEAHVQLLDRFKRVVGARWRWASEVPLPMPGDKRAWDRMLKGADLSIGIEGETRPTDMQELGRRLGLKRRDGGVDRLILVLADTRWCRQLVRLNELGSSFPIPGRDALKALAEGRDPGGDAIVLI